MVSGAAAQPPGSKPAAADLTAAQPPAPDPAVILADVPNLTTGLLQGTGFDLKGREPFEDQLGRLTTGALRKLCEAWRKPDRSFGTPTSDQSKIRHLPKLKDLLALFFSASC